jgi:hypothetical protein
MSLTYLKISLAPHQDFSDLEPFLPPGLQCLHVDGTAMDVHGSWVQKPMTSYELPPSRTYLRLIVQHNDTFVERAPRGTAISPEIWVPHEPMCEIKEEE